MEGALSEPQAPAFIWLILATVLAAWWLVPWLTNTSERAGQKAAEAPVESNKSLPKAAPVATADATVLSTVGTGGEDRNNRRPPRIHVDDPKRLSAEADPKQVFREAFAFTARHIAAVLPSAPQDPRYTTAINALYFVGSIVDRIIESWGTPEAERVSKLRTSSTKFQQALGSHPNADELLQCAGFQPKLGDGNDDDGDGSPGGGDGELRWIFPLESAEARMRALAVRLCLLKLEAKAKARGLKKWIADSNTALLPSPEEGSFVELPVAFRSAPPPTMEAGAGGVPPAPSKREQNVETIIRAKLGARRTELRLPPIETHQGLTEAARALAHAQRCRLRIGDAALTASTGLDAEVHSLVKRLLLPPGLMLVHLHFNSGELPHVFGLASTRGGKSDDSSEDKAADYIAREAMGVWQVREREDLDWSPATVCGIGTSLDYAKNLGYVCLLLAGYEDEPLRTNSVTQHDGLRDRRPKKPDAAPRPSPPANNRPTGPRISTLRSTGPPGGARRGG